MWISLGSIIHGSEVENVKLPLSVSECDNSTLTVNSTLPSTLNDFQSWNTTDTNHFAVTTAAE